MHTYKQTHTHMCVCVSPRWQELNCTLLLATSGGAVQTEARILKSQVSGSFTL